MKRNWSRIELEEKFTLEPPEQAALPNRTPHGRLGFAALLKFLQVAGRFPLTATEVPPTIAQHLATQIEVPVERLRQYAWEGRTVKRHRARIRALTGFRETRLEDVENLGGWLLEHLDQHDDSHPRETAYERLRTLRIEPPTPERMERIVHSAVYAYEQRLLQKVLSRLSKETRRQLDTLLDSPGPAAEVDHRTWSKSSLAEILSDPGPPGLESVLTEVAKLERIRQMNLPDHVFDRVAPRVPQRYRRRAAVEDPRELRRHPEPLRYTMLAAVCWERGREITDNLVDLLIQVVRRISARAEKKVVKELLQDLIRVQGKTSILLRLVEAAVAEPDGVIREVLYPVVDEQTLRDLIRDLKSSGPTYRLQVHTRMKASYSHHYRRMLPKILNALKFLSNNEMHRPVIDALALLERYADSRVHFYTADEEVPTEGIVSATWEDLVYKIKNDRQRIHRIAYEICVLQALRDRLRTKEIWVVGADRYRNPDDDLPADFAERRGVYYEALDQPLDADAFLSNLQGRMERALRTFEDRLNSGLNGTRITRRGHFKIPRLKAQKEPQNLLSLKAEIARRWPMTSLLDILKEADLRVSFTDSLHSASPQKRLDPETLRKRLLLCLYALGTNLGIKHVSSGDHGESYRDLVYVRRRFLHKDQLRSAVAHLVNGILEVRLSQIWGEGTTACASDSKQFGAWDQNLMTEWHARYGGPGVMIYWHVEQKSACIYSQLKRCSSSEVASMIEGVLRHCTTMAIDQQYVDSHGQSQVAFAFCYLLGFRLLPRLKGIHHQKLYRARAGQTSAYANLQAVLTRPINWNLIRQQYDEMIKFATALRLGTAAAETILRRFTRDNLQHPTYRALSELGKAVKTIFLCEYLGSEELRREIHEGLNVIESWNSAIEFIFFARSGDFVTNRREHQEIVMLSLQLLQNCLVYVNTLMIQDVLTTSEWQNRLTEGDLRALTPLIYAHVNPYGSFHLDMNERLPIGVPAPTS